MFQSGPHAVSGSCAAGRGRLFSAVAGGWKVDGRRKRKIQCRRLRRMMKRCDLELGSCRYFFGSYTSHWCTFSVLPGCDEIGKDECFEMRASVTHV